MKIFNTLSRKIEDFKPINKNAVSYYACGPTVYDYTHVGHIRTYINNDLLKRTLNFLGYEVNFVMNITDVGHLSGDTDEGEDKLEKGAAMRGKTVWQVAEYFTGHFLSTMSQVNVLPADHLVKATDHIAEMIDLITKLEQKGYVYKTGEAVYFDTSKFKKYGALSGQKLEDKKTGARDDVNIDKDKNCAADFSLWFFRVGRFKDHQMHWASPWGDGFPGWHIECSAMSMKYLGETIDIHAGGTDHIPVHHENEIAQSEAATGKQFVKYWFHNAWLLVDGVKMSKSLGNYYTIEDIKKHNIDPLAFRYLFLQTHYRQQMNFTWDSAIAAQSALTKLRDTVRALRTQTQRTSLSEEKLQEVDVFRQRFTDTISNDLQIPQAVAVMWEMLKSNIPSADKLDLLFEFDTVFGLKLNEVSDVKIPDEITALAGKREQARKSKNFAESDRIRKDIENKGFTIEDVQDRYIIKPK